MRGKAVTFRPHTVPNFFRGPRGTSEQDRRRVDENPQNVEVVKVDTLWHFLHRRKFPEPCDDDLTLAAMSQWRCDGGWGTSAQTNLPDWPKETSGELEKKNARRKVWAPSTDLLLGR